MGWCQYLTRGLLFASLVWAPFAWASAEVITEHYPQVRHFFPEADRFGPIEGEPPAAAVYQGKKLLGYVFRTYDVVRIPAYSGGPINTLVGFDLAGRIVGIQIIEHEEPILVVGITEARLGEFVAQYRGKGVFDRITIGAERAGHVSIDTISGATITVMVENATVIQSVRQVAAARGLTPESVAVAQASAPPLPPAEPLPVISRIVDTPLGLKQKSRAKDFAPAELPKAKATRVPAAPGVTRTAKEVLADFEDDPIWLMLWSDRVFEIVVLWLGVGFLTLILVFQDWLTKHPTLLKRLRTGFLIYTTVFVGWYALGQLSVVNVLTFTNAVMRGFQWESFLIDPMLFILWSFVAVALLLWGRGVYCGWLCPFGALQELTWQFTQRLKLPRFEFPQMVHERLWALKYLILIVLFGVSLQSLSTAERLAEVEPFKTAFTLNFAREWGFLIYATALIGISMLNRKFYCKYLCALGAALTIPAKFRIFDWLRRHRECGRPCQVCAQECEVQAIRKNGEINPNECHYCMDCQVTYWNSFKCPPEVERRKRRERAGRAREMVGRMEQHLGPSGLEEADDKSTGQGTPSRGPGSPTDPKC